MDENLHLPSAVYKETLKNVVEHLPSESNINSKYSSAVQQWAKLECEQTFGSAPLQECSA